MLYCPNGEPTVDAIAFVDETGQELLDIPLDEVFTDKVKKRLAYQVLTAARG